MTVPKEGELLLVNDLRLGPAQHDETLQLLQRRLRQIERHRHREAFLGSEKFQICREFVKKLPSKLAPHN